jgi:hypothetical protein
MIELAELRARCVAAVSRAIALANACISDPLPQSIRFDLWLIPT